MCWMGLNVIDCLCTYILENYKGTFFLSNGGHSVEYNTHSSVLVYTCVPRLSDYNVLTHTNAT